MNIVFCINKEYIDKLGTVMVSILENNSECFIHFYIMHSSLTSIEKQVLSKLNNKYKNFDINYLEINKDIFKDFTINIEYISIETYYRYLIADLIDADKCLYLDADMAVNGSLYELYTTDIDKYCCAGVTDLFAGTETYKSSIGLAKKEYINAGVILFNLKKIREENYTKKLFDNHKFWISKIKYQDQDVINITFVDNIKIIDATYNCNKTNKEALYAKILHFCGPVKPWDENFNCITKKVWQKYNNKYIQLTQGMYKFLSIQAFHFVQRIFSVRIVYPKLKLQILGIKISIQLNDNVSQRSNPVAAAERERVIFLYERNYKYDKVA